MSKVKVIFVDIDGVLNNIGQFISNESVYIADAKNLDSVAVGILRWICKCTGAKIVISSSWRILHKHTEWYNGVFSAFGWHDIDVIDVTPDKNGHRGTEIAEWLGNHRHIVNNYVIIDDDSDMLPEQNFVHIDRIVGLTLYNAVDIIKLLGVLPDQKKQYSEILKHVNFKRYNNGKIKQVY